MLLSAVSTAALAVPLDLALPEDPSGVLEDREEWGFGFDPAEATPYVVGGKPVRENRWDDAVGVVFSGAYVGCTGTLIGPRVVLTAGHCVIGSDVTDVLVGSKNWLAGDGVGYAVESVVEYPNSQRTRDIALLFLAEPVKNVEPRAIGMECITEAYLEKGAPVQIVGYGATNEQGTDFNTLLNEARSKVLDPTCKEDYVKGIYAGCSPAARPAGEVSAGGNGIDACFGDSGGPLYLLTDEGDFVIGATSRAFLGVSQAYPCRDGGIWVRPDAVIDWILDEAGPRREIAMPTCNEAPTADVDLLEVRGTQEGSVELDVDDPDGDSAAATLEITVPPEHGTATLDGTTVRYTADDGYVGSDSVTVSVTDEGTRWEYTGQPQSADIVVDISVVERGLGCGCDGTGSVGFGLGTVAVGLLALRRRR